MTDELSRLEERVERLEGQLHDLVGFVSAGGALLARAGHVMNGNDAASSASPGGVGELAIRGEQGDLEGGG